MGTIIGRTRKDGSKAFVAQIVIKKAGAIVHREAKTFDRKQAANAWVVKREAELKRPGGLDHKEDPTLAAVIDRYITESENVVLGTKAQVLKSIKNSDLGETKCSDITSRTLVEQLSFSKTNVTSLDWATYPILRFKEAPKVTPIVVQRTDLQPGGVGEPVSMAATAAIANAVFDATGVRMRQAPFTPAKVRAALKAAGVV